MSMDDIGKHVIAHHLKFRYEGELLEETDILYVIRDRKNQNKIKVPKMHTCLQVVENEK